MKNEQKIGNGISLRGWRYAGGGYSLNDKDAIKKIKSDYNITNFDILEQLFKEKYAQKKRVSKLIVEFLNDAKNRGYNGYNKYIASYLGHKEDLRPIQQYLIDKLNIEL